MSKRSADGEPEYESKRQKLEQREGPKEVEEIRSAQQLQQLLTFQQDAIPHLRAGV